MGYVIFDPRYIVFIVANLFSQYLQFCLTAFSRPLARTSVICCRLRGQSKGKEVNLLWLELLPLLGSD